MDNAYVRSTTEALGFFKVSEQNGLSDQQVKSLQDRYGPNGTASLPILCAVI